MVQSVAAEVRPHGSNPGSAPSELYDWTIHRIFPVLHLLWEGGKNSTYYIRLWIGPKESGVQAPRTVPGTL